MMRNRQRYQVGIWFVSTLLAALVVTGCATKSDGPVARQSIAAQSGVEFDKSAEQQPTAKTLFSMARLMASQGRNAESKQVLIRVVTEYPEFMPGYLELAELQVRQRRLDDAMRSLSAGLDLAPGDHVLLNNLGMCWVLKSDFNKALAHFTRAAGTTPQNALYRANMAMALGMAGRYEESLVLC